MDRFHQIMFKYISIVVILSAIAPTVYFFTGSLVFLVLFNSFNFALNVAAMWAAIDALRAAEPLRELLSKVKVVADKPSGWQKLRSTLFRHR